MQIDVVDVNHDGVATRDDLDMLISYLTSSITSFPDTNASGYRTIDDITAKNNGTRTYLKHDYSNNTTTSYDLTTSTMGFAGWDGTSPAGGSIVGSTFADISNTNWTLNNLSNAILQVGHYFYDENDEIQLTPFGTAFIIDEDKLATAAHCVYNKNIGVNDWVENLAVKDANGNIYIVSEAHFPQSFLTYFPDSTYDYGLIRVDLPNTATSLPFGMITDDTINTMASYFNLSGVDSNPVTHIVIAGFAGEDNRDNSEYYGEPLNNWELYNMVVGWGNLFNPGTTLPENEDWYLYSRAAGHGGSGSPIIFDVDGNPATNTDRFVIGINTGTNKYVTGGPRFTAQQFKFYNNNSNF